MTQVEIFLYCDKLSKSPDKVTTNVPFRVSDKYIFFGPSEPAFRKELRDRFLIYTDDIKPQNEIYMVGVNDLTKGGEVRKILWVGKFLEIMTFELAFRLLKDPDWQSLEFVPDVKDPSINMSPLHLEPMEIMGNLSGYRHRSAYHPKVSKDGVPDWVKDIIDPRDMGEIMIKPDELLFEDISRSRKILKRDCCFTFDNIFFADGEGMSIDKELVALLDERQPGQGVDEVGIFGYSQGRDGKIKMNRQKGTSLHIRWSVAEGILEYIKKRA